MRCYSPTYQTLYRCSNPTGYLGHPIPGHGRILPVRAGPHRPHLTLLEASSRCQSHRLKMKNISELYGSEKSVRLTDTSGNSPASGEQQGFSSPFRGLVAKNPLSYPFLLYGAGNVRRCLRMANPADARRRLFFYDCFLNHTNDRFRPV